MWPSFLNGIWDNLQKERYITGSKIPLGTTLIIMQANEGPWPIFMFWDCKLPFAQQYTLQLSCALHTERGFSPLPPCLRLCISAPSCGQWIKNPGSEGPGDRPGRYCSPWHHGWWQNLSRYLRRPSLCFAWQWRWKWQTFHKGLLSLNATSSAIWDGLRIRDTYTELLQGPTEASHLSTKVAVGQGK